MSHLPDYYIIIPARLASSRLPRKVLLDIAGQPMLVWVADAAKKSNAKGLWVATDSQEVAAVCNQFNLPYVITQSHHTSGTERLAEAASLLGLNEDAIIVNVQADEPLIEPTLIDELALCLAKTTASVATLAHPIHTEEEFHNHNMVKVVLNHQQEALYFSRSLIPFPRQIRTDLPVLRHIGLYAYRAHFLHWYSTLKPSVLEQVESLEQLRILYYGKKIYVEVTSTTPSVRVDTEKDLQYVSQLLHKRREAL